MTEELKPCAHCNHAAEWKYDKYADINIDNPDPFGKIFCLGCGMQTGELSTYSEAIAAWNRRVEPIENSDELPEWITSYCNERILDLEEWRAEQNHEDLELRERAYYMIKAFKEILSLRKPEVTQ